MRKMKNTYVRKAVRASEQRPKTKMKKTQAKYLGKATAMSSHRLSN